MNEVLDESMLERIITISRSVTSDDDVESAPIKFDTMVMAPPGKTIAGEDIYNLIQEAKAEGVTLASKMRNLQGASVQTFVSPGPGVVRQATRSGRKKRRGNRQLRAQDRAWREQQKRE